MQRTLILYESKYGSTYDMVKNMALILGPASCCRVDEFKPEYKNFEFFVLGSPIYEEKIDEKILRFAADNIEWLKRKKTAIFCTCLSIERESAYLKELDKLLGESVVLKRALGGKLVLGNLESGDYSLIASFFKKLKLPVRDVELSKLEDTIEFALQAKALKDDFIKPVKKELLKEKSERYLALHNTCTLCTCSNNKARSTPIEYNYKDGYMYFFTEGGEKFSNLLLNPEVSISVYDSYEGRPSLKGMQISGRAELVERFSSEYMAILNERQIKIEALNRYPFIMNMLKVKLHKIEFLNSEFSKFGADEKQIYRFDC